MSTIQNNMKIVKTSLLVIAAALVLSACNATGQTTTSAPTTPTPPITANPTPAPTKPQTMNELKGELNATVDDGGAADLKALQTDSQGL